MLARPCLPVLCGLLIVFTGAAAQTVTPPVAPTAPTAPTAEAVPPRAGKLLGGDGFDGHLFLAMGRAPGWQEGVGGRASALVGWNAGFVGFTSRLAGGTAYQGAHFPTDQGPHTRLTHWSFGVDEAWLRYPLEVFSWNTAVQAGWFRWRSHADAALAGEYLTRWNDYPGSQVRPEGAWEAQDSLTSLLTGLRFTLDSPHRRFRQEALVLLDTTFYGTGLSLLWSLNIAPLPGIEAGFAVEQDRYWEPEDSPIVDYTGRYVHRDSLADTGQVAQVDTFTTTRYVIDSRSVSARLTVDPVMLFQGTPRADRGGRIYFETALLGWENVPTLFGDRLQRLHFNAGLYLPAFGWLDILRLQAELWPEPLERNSLLEIYDATIPVPTSSGGDSTGYVPSARAEGARGWSVQLYLSRAVLPWLDVQAWSQLARTRKYGRQDFLLSPGPVRIESAYWTSFEVRIAARL